MSDLPIDMAALKERVRADRSAAPAVGLGTAARLVAAAGFGVLFPAAVGLLSLRPDYRVHPLFQLSIYGAVLIALAVMLAWRATRPEHIVERPRTWLWVALALVGPVLLALLPPAHHAHPISLIGAGPNMVPIALGCLGFGVFIGVLPFLVTRLVDRGERWMGDGLFAAAMMGGVAGNLALVLHCPVVWTSHQLLGHATVGLVYLGGVAAWWGLSRPR